MNEVQNDVTGEEKGVTRVTVDGIHGERLMWWWGGASCSIVSPGIGMGLVTEYGLSEVKVMQNARNRFEEAMRDSPE